MFYSNKVKMAMNDCFAAHKCDIDKGGYPYFHHPLTIALQFDDEETVCVALLHDVVEDHGDKFTIDYIRRKYGTVVAYAVGLLTHDKETPYLEYINRIKGNEIARKVKLADLKHNIDLSRLDKGQKTSKYETYKEAIKMLKR